MDPSVLARLADEPKRAAILHDVDGTLAPIVARPGDARVPDAVRKELARLAGRYALVACVSGRPGSNAAKVVGVEGIDYVGEHGLEIHPEAELWTEKLLSFAASVGRRPEEGKRFSLAFHYRTAPDQYAALAEHKRVEERALAEGFRTRWGKMVLEILPPIDANKGTAVRWLLEKAAVRRALYAGDDTTDLDAFRALDGLDVAVRVAVASEEAPAGLSQAADIVVDSPEAFADLVRKL
jgi:trehalose 6-phosphate phosphatase